MNQDHRAELATGELRWLVVGYFKSAQAVIVHAFGLHDAFYQARLRGLVPPTSKHVEVVGVSPYPGTPPPSWVNRVLSGADLEELLVELRRGQ